MYQGRQLKEQGSHAKSSDPASAGKESDIREGGRALPPLPRTEREKGKPRGAAGKSKRAGMQLPQGKVLPQGAESNQSETTPRLLKKSCCCWKGRGHLHHPISLEQVKHLFWPLQIITRYQQTMRLHAVLQDAALIRVNSQMWNSHTSTRFGVAFFTLGGFSSELNFHKGFFAKSTFCAWIRMHGKEKWAFSRTSWLESSCLKLLLDPQPCIQASVCRQRS